MKKTRVRVEELLREAEMLRAEAADLVQEANVLELKAEAACKHDEQSVTSRYVNGNYDTVGCTITTTVCAACGKHLSSTREDHEGDYA